MDPVPAAVVMAMLAITSTNAVRAPANMVMVAEEAFFLEAAMPPVDDNERIDNFISFIYYCVIEKLICDGTMETILRIPPVSKLQEIKFLLACAFENVVMIHLSERRKTGSPN